MACWRRPWVCVFQTTAPKGTETLETSHSPSEPRRQAQKSCGRAGVSAEFPFLVTKLSPYYDG